MKRVKNAVEMKEKNREKKGLLQKQRRVGLTKSDEKKRVRAKFAANSGDH